MRHTLGIVLVGVVGVAEAGPSAPRPTASAPEAATPLDRGHAYYREDSDGRRVARVDATLERRGSSATLRIEASAVEPLIEPPLGSEGIRGSNAVTAREMATLVGEDRIRVRVAGVPEVGRVAVGRVGRVLERHLRADGSIERRPATDEDVPLGLVLETAAAGDGRHHAEVVVDGRVAVRVVFDVRGERGRILSVDCLGHAEGRALR